MPPNYACKQSAYKNISENDRPAILMNIDDHRKHDTTSRRNFNKNHSFRSAEEQRDYLQDEMQQNDFYAAIIADLDFLLKNKLFIIKYTVGETNDSVLQN